MTELGLKPVDDAKLKGMGIYNMHIHTFANMIQKYTSLDQYRLVVEEEKKVHEIKAADYEVRKQKVLAEMEKQRQA